MQQESKLQSLIILSAMTAFIGAALPAFAAPSAPTLTGIAAGAPISASTVSGAFTTLYNNDTALNTQLGNLDSGNWSTSSSYLTYNAASGMSLKLQSATGNANLSICSNHADGKWMLSSKHSGDDGGLQFYNSTTGKIPLYLVPNGNVGIGTNAPAFPLDVQSSASGYAMRIKMA
jgi:hypothetical protein